ncbi:hypothetical protein DPM19_08865 [Actinomadura craniellae]|uniref:NYN domain-containing protein n=1 Tax=Actinomadura craniellae TaxID=2231787 RepID=A0A365H9V2_9ACTN|nr:hypothetical protein [Actinomadura craniellae]RAY15861.1 hypothetical protein DPM19_08865 [Actinomadura craniellae]
MNHRNAAPRRALLIDFENMLFESARLADYGLVADRLIRTVETAGPVHHRLLVARPWALKQHLELFIALRLPIAVAPRGRDGADHVLLDRGRFLAGHGFTEFSIASRDHIFADFAAAHPTDVIVPTPHSVSRALVRAARRLIVLSPN